MNKLITSFILLLSVSCIENNQLDNITKVTPLSGKEQPTVTFPEVNPPYQIKLDIDSTDKNEHNLIVSIDIYDKDFLESPHSNGNFVNHFTISLDETKNLSSEDSNLELPMPLESPYSIENESNLVKRSSVYTQKFIINSQDDFETTGLLRFVIEPNYTMENIKFVISQQSGVLSIKKLQASVCFGIFSHISCAHS